MNVSLPCLLRKGETASEEGIKWGNEGEGFGKMVTVGFGKVCKLIHHFYKKTAHSPAPAIKLRIYYATKYM